MTRSEHRSTFSVNRNTPVNANQNPASKLPMKRKRPLLSETPGYKLLQAYTKYRDASEDVVGFGTNELTFSAYSLINSNGVTFNTPTME